MTKIYSMNYVRFAVLILVLCFSTLVAAAPIKVELQVVGDELKVKVNEKPCDDVTPTSDCIKVAENEKPFIIFNLPKACGDDAGDPKYKLRNIRISLIKKVWPTKNDPLNAQVAADFKADPETGNIDFNSGNNKKTNKKLKFKDLNKHAYTVFYEITAIHCDESSDADNIHLDPEIRNKGRN
jgi:hypothetical protein